MQQAIVDVFKPDPKGKYADRLPQSGTEIVQPSRPKKPSSLPSAREIDAALAAKYGIAPYRET